MKKNVIAYFFFVAILSGNVAGFENNRTSPIDNSASDLQTKVDLNSFKNTGVTEEATSLELKCVESRDCVWIYANCLDDIIEASKDCGFCFPGGSLWHLVRVAFCAGRYMDCINQD